MRWSAPGGWTGSIAAAVPPVTAVVGAMLVGAVMLSLLGADPLTAYGALLAGAFGSLRALSDTLLKAAPLILVGVGIVVAFRANVINIGGEGQIILGGLFAATTALAIGDAPSMVILPVTLLAGFVGGGLWGAIPGALKAHLGVNEILSTIMLNIVALKIMNFLLRGPLIDPGQSVGAIRIPQTARLPATSDLPVVVPGSRVNAGILIAVGAAVVIYLLLWRTPMGYRLRAVGLSPEASRYAGIPVERSITLALTISGALAGLAGAVLVLGSESHRLVTDGTAFGFTGAAGYNGIVTALFGALHPLWTVLSSFIFAGLLVGANAMQRATQVPSSLVMALNGLVVVFVVSSYWLARRFRERVERPATGQTGSVSAGAPARADEAAVDHVTSTPGTRT